MTDDYFGAALEVQRYQHFFRASMRQQISKNFDQLPLFDTRQYEHPITEASIDCEGWESTPVATKTVERVYFFSVGSRVTFHDDNIASAPWNGKEATVESLRSPINPNRVVIRFDDGSRLHPTHEQLKSTPVPNKTVQRVYFHWVEEYLMRQRYQHFRYCYIRVIDDIRQVEKIHIAGGSRSVREGRAQLVREAIADGKTPDEILAIINCW